MSEAAVAEVTELQTSPAGTPDSEATPAPPSTEEAAPPSTGLETPSVEDAKPETPPALQSPEERYAYLDKKFEDSGLVGEEAREYKRLKQSVDDRRAAAEKRLTESRRVDQEQDEAAKRIVGALYTDIDKEIDALLNRPEGLTDASRELTRNNIWALVQQFQGMGSVVFTHATKAEMRDVLLEEWGDSDDLRNRIRNAPLANVREAYEGVLKSRIEKQVKGNPDALVLSQKEIDAKYITREEHQKAIDALKAANPEWQTAETGSSTRNGSARLYSQMTTEERTALSPEDKDRLVAEEARVRSQRS